MKSLLKYLKNYKKEAVFAPLFKMLEAGFELFVPLVMASIIDIGIRQKEISHIFKMGGILIILGIVGLVCSVTAQYFAAKAAVGFGTALRKELFEHIHTLSYAEIDKEGTSTLITRMTSDVNQVQSGVNLTLRLFLRSPFIVFGSMIMAFTIDTRSAMIFVVIIPILSVVVFGIMLCSMPLYKKVQKQLDRVLQITRENLTGARVVRAFNRQKEEQEAFEESCGMLFRLQTFVGRIAAALNPVTYILINAAILCLIQTGGERVNDGFILQGEVVALVNYMSQILVELIKLANLIISVTKAFACAGRISQVFDTESSITDPKTPALSEQFNQFNQFNQFSQSEYSKNENLVPKVEFSGVSFSYQDAKAETLTELNFKVMKGETIGIIGGTGSGKSTLVNLIPRFYDVISGSVLVDGVDVRTCSLKELRQKIGVVPQKAVLFRGTIRDNMKWGNQDASDQEIEAALEIAQAKEVVESKKNGLDEWILQGGSNLSGGQKQRLTIARALLKKPEILILDDSASALDYVTDAKLRKALKEKTDTMTVFIVSQRASSVRFADQILVLEDGKMAAKGTHEELLEHCQLYREICQSQLSNEEVSA